MTTRNVLLILLLLALLIFNVVSATGVVVNPGAGYFVIHNTQHHEHYVPSGYSAPKEVADNLFIFVLVCLVGGPITLLGICSGNPIITTVLVIVFLIIMVWYIFPTFTLMSNAMMKEMCVPNPAFNSSCGDLK